MSGTFTLLGTRDPSAEVVLAASSDVVKAASVRTRLWLSSLLAYWASQQVKELHRLHHLHKARLLSRSLKLANPHRPELSSRAARASFNEGSHLHGGQLHKPHQQLEGAV
jgi:hypothetical protein